MSQSCATCKFWHPQWHERARDELGECHRHAPGMSLRITISSFDEQRDGIWPATNCRQWCGDWQEYIAPPKDSPQ